MMENERKMASSLFGRDIGEYPRSVPIGKSHTLHINDPKGDSDRYVLENNESGTHGPMFVYPGSPSEAKEYGKLGKQVFGFEGLTPDDETVDLLYKMYLNGEI